jgi:hypothetical protein
MTVRIQFRGWKASIGQVMGGLDDSLRGGVGVIMVVGDVVATVGLGVDGVMVTTAVLYTVVVIQYVIPASGSSPEPLQKKLGSSGCNPSAALPDGNGVIMELWTISSPSTAVTSTSSTHGMCGVRRRKNQQQEAPPTNKTKQKERKKDKQKMMNYL